MGEKDQSSKRLQNLMRKSILVMVVLLILCPFELQVRISWYFYPQTQISLVTLFSWFGEYRLVGYEPGYYSTQFYLLAQFGSIPTSAQIFFLGAFIGLNLGLTDRKTAVRFGIISLIPSLVILVVNLFGVFVPGATEVIIPIPLLAVSILGLIILRLTRSEPLKNDWLPEQSQLNQE